MGQVGESCVPGAAAPSTEFGAGRLVEPYSAATLLRPATRWSANFVLMATQEARGGGGPQAKRSSGTTRRCSALSNYVPQRVIVTPAVNPRLVESLHFDIQSTGQKSHCVNIYL